MNKQAPSLGKVLIMVGFALSCFGLILFLWLAFGGPTPLKPKGYRFTVSFGEATQLADEADVRISGVPVGKVRELKTNPQTGRTDATIELDSAYAPLPSDARAVLRQKTLLGETYVELTPGSPTAPKLPENGRLAVGQVGQTVELDEIFRAFDPKTRAAFRTWMQQQALSIDGRGQDLNEALGNLAPFETSTTDLLRTLNSQTGAVRQLVRNTGAVFSALTARDDELASLIHNSNEVFRVTARRDTQIADAFRALPTFEKESILTVNRLSKFAKDTNPLITAMRPAARELSPTLVSLAALAPELKALFVNLNPLIDVSKAGLPALVSFNNDLRPLFPEFSPFLAQLNPLLDVLGHYNSDITAFFANSVAATQAAGPVPGSSDLVHYLRVSNPLNPEILSSQYPVRIGTNRPNPYTFPDNANQLKSGLPIFEDRQCGRGDPVVEQPSAALLADPTNIFTPSLIDRTITFAFGGGTPTAPACRKQPKFNVSGKVTQYPQVAASTAGANWQGAGG